MSPRAGRPTIERTVPRLGLNVTEVAQSIGVSPNTVHDMVEKGLLPRPRCFGRRRIWRTAEIDAAMSEWPIDGEDEEIGAPDGWKARA